MLKGAKMKLRNTTTMRISLIRKTKKLSSFFLGLAGWVERSGAAGLGSVIVASIPSRSSRVKGGSVLGIYSSQRAGWKGRRGELAIAALASRRGGGIAGARDQERPKR